MRKLVVLTALLAFVTSIYANEAYIKIANEDQLTSHSSMHYCVFTTGGNTALTSNGDKVGTTTVSISKDTIWNPSTNCVECMKNSYRLYSYNQRSIGPTKTAQGNNIWYVGNQYGVATFATHWSGATCVWQITNNGCAMQLLNGTTRNVSAVYNGTTLTAYARAYHVRFVVGDLGTMVADDSVRYCLHGDTIISKPQVMPIDTNMYAFVGWSLEKDATTPCDTLVLESDTTFYAVYRGVSHTIQFEVGENGELQGETPITVTESFVLPSVTTAAGVTFVGWSTVLDDQTSLIGNAGEWYHPAKSLTLYALYELLPTTLLNTSIKENVDKVIWNGHLWIHKNGIWFDISGLRK